jgi:hypothetical protein
MYQWNSTQSLQYKMKVYLFTICNDVENSEAARRGTLLTPRLKPRIVTNICIACQLSFGGVNCDVISTHKSLCPDIVCTILPLRVVVCSYRYFESFSRHWTPLITREHSQDQSTMSVPLNNLRHLSLSDHCVLFIGNLLVLSISLVFSKWPEVSPNQMRQNPRQKNDRQFETCKPCEWINIVTYTSECRRGVDC